MKRCSMWLLFAADLCSPALLGSCVENALFKPQDHQAAAALTVCCCCFCLCCCSCSSCSSCCCCFYCCRCCCYCCCCSCWLLLPLLLLSSLSTLPRVRGRYPWVRVHPNQAPPPQVFTQRLSTTRGWECPTPCPPPTPAEVIGISVAAGCLWVSWR